MTVISFPQCRGPRDLPEVRAWLSDLYKPHSHFAEFATDVRFIRETLGTAKLWWVTKETCDMLAASSPTIPDDVTLRWEDIPIPSGFAVFEHDLMGSDAEISGAEVRISAMMWGPVQLPPIGAERIGENLYEDINEPGRIGLGIGMWTRANLDEGLTGDMLSRHSGTLAALSAMQTLAQYDPHSLTGDIFTYIGRTDWLNGRPITLITPGANRSSEHTARSMTEDRKLITALWAITRMPILSVVDEHIPRFIARRSTRRGYNADVQVLTLRGPKLDQPSAEPHADGGRDWQHQWIVGPHWRWQPYGPQRTLRRLTLIGAHRKGPADKPLLGAERVWKVVPPQGAPRV